MFGFPSKDTLKLIGALLIGGVILFAYQKISSWKAAADLSVQQTRTAEATTGIIGDGAKSDKERQAESDGLSSGRESFNASIQKARQSDQSLLHRASQPVPPSVLDAYRQRRLTRDRFGCAGAGCGAQPEADTPTKWEGILSRGR